MLELLRHLYGPTIGAAGPRLPWQMYAILLLAIVIASTIHVFGHAWMADRLGDGTPRCQRRVTLNPFAHVDPLGGLLMVATTLIGYPIGWGRPLRTNPEAYRTGPRIGLALVAGAGPLANLLTAVLLSPIARVMIAILFDRKGDVSQTFIWTLTFVAATMLVNISLFVFNLTPISPFDGAHLLASALPPTLSKSYREFMAAWGQYLMLFMMVTNVLPQIFAPIIHKLFSLLIGIEL